MINKISLLFFVFSLVCFAFENIFFGSINQNNVLQDSFFLPLGFICLFISVFLLCAYVAQWVWKRFR
jgi:hypothetical protein